MSSVAHVQNTTTPSPPHLVGVRHLSPSEQIVDKADPLEHKEFVRMMQAESKRSSVTGVDDYPVESHKWDTVFPIFGTKYNVGASRVMFYVSLFQLS